MSRVPMANCGPERQRCRLHRTSLGKETFRAGTSKLTHPPKPLGMELALVTQDVAVAQVDRLHGFALQGLI